MKYVRYSGGWAAFHDAIRDSLREAFDRHYRKKAHKIRSTRSTRGRTSRR